MSKNTEMDIPLSLRIVFEEIEDIEVLKTSEEFLELIHKGAVAAIKQAIRKNKSDCILFNVENLNLKIKIDKSEYKKLIDSCIKYYETIEDYTTCQRLVRIKERI
jgi:hypothetical protein